MRRLTTTPLSRAASLRAIWLWAVIMLAFAAPLGVHAQDDPSPAQLLRQWQARQAEAARRVTRIEFAEHTEKEYDGPFGPRRHLIRARTTGNLRSNTWNREVVSFEKDGYPPREREEKRGNDRSREHHDGRRHTATDDREELFLRMLLMPQHLLDKTEPAGPVLREMLDGAPTLRVDVAPETVNKHLPIQQITVWFHPEHHSLLRTRTVIQQPGEPSSLLVTTDYERRDGLDVPVRRKTEGTVQVQRRLRTFTLLVDIDSEFSDYRFLRL